MCGMCSCMLCIVTYCMCICGVFVCLCVCVCVELVQAKCVTFVVHVVVFTTSSVTTCHTVSVT